MEIVVKFAPSAFKHGITGLEILYNVIDEQTVRVFHAMKCRHIFRALLEK